MLTLIALAATLAGCANSDGDAARGTVVRDSAGVTIVENAGDGWSSEDAWRVDPEPAAEIGTFGGDTLYELYRVRGVERLSDGTIVVANAGTHQLRFYDAEGRFLRSVGREGGGPGEFRGMMSLARLPGDTLIVADWGHRHTALFAPDGTPVRNIRPELEGRTFPIALSGGFANGPLVGVMSPVYSSGSARRGPTRDSLTVVTFGRDGELLDTLGVFVSSELFVDAAEGYMRLRAMPFQRQTEYALDGEHLHLGATDRFEIGMYDPEGRLVRSVRLSREPRPVTERDAERWRSTQLEDVEEPEELRRREAALSEMPMPATMPAFADLRVDGSGHLWVKEHRPDWETEGPDRWLVFDPEGRLLGPVELPAEITVEEIGEDYILARAQDEMDVEYVRVYRLTRTR